MSEVWNAYLFFGVNNSGVEIMFGKRKALEN